MELNKTHFWHFISTASDQLVLLRNFNMSHMKIDYSLQELTEVKNAGLDSNHKSDIFTFLDTILTCL